MYFYLYHHWKHYYDYDEKQDRTFVISVVILCIHLRSFFLFTVQQHNNYYYHGTVKSLRRQTPLVQNNPVHPIPSKHTTLF